MAGLRRLLVTGATGKQGGALISALLAKPTPSFEIYALTRDASSRKAQLLSQQPNVHVVQGNFDKPEDIFKHVEDPWGVFSVTMPMNAKKEERQGKAMTEAAVAAGVKHLVYTSTERGGQIESDTNPTSVPHFVSKFNIEQDIVSKATANNFTYTLLRPVAFFENITNDFLGNKGFVSMWRLNGRDEKMQMISSRDVGTIAAEAFLNADKDEYRNKSISLAADELSPNEAAKIFKEVTGQEIVATYPWVGSGLRWALREQLGLMFDWMKRVGFGVEMANVKRKYPSMLDFRAWLNEESAWKKSG